MSKQDELAQLEARKQAILQGMGEHQASYPETESYGQHMSDVTDAQNDANLRQVRPLDANPYAPRDHDGIMTMSDAAPAGQRMASRSMYPEQDAQSSQIAALEKRLKALQGY